MDKLTFGEWLRIKRERQGLHQSELSALLGVSPQTISNWERGITIPTLNPAQTLKLCQTLKVFLIDLVDAFEYSHPRNI